MLVILRREQTSSVLQYGHDTASTRPLGTGRLLPRPHCCTRSLSLLRVLLLPLFCRKRHTNPRSSLLRQFHLPHEGRTGKQHHGVRRSRLQTLSRERPVAAKNSESLNRLFWFKCPNCSYARIYGRCGNGSVAFLPEIVLFTWAAFGHFNPSPLTPPRTSSVQRHTPGIIFLITLDLASFSLVFLSLLPGFSGELTVYGMHFGDELLLISSLAFRMWWAWLCFCCFWHGLPALCRPPASWRTPVFLTFLPA